MADHIISLKSAELLHHFPKDYRNEKGGDYGMVYTLAYPHAFGVEVPYFKDPSHLAAWLAGFAAHNNSVLDHDGDN